MRSRRLSGGWDGCCTLGERDARALRNERAFNLLSRIPRVTYAEGSTGPGFSRKGEPGSPIIALSIAVTAGNYLTLAHASRCSSSTRQALHRSLNCWIVATLESHGRPRPIGLHITTLWATETRQCYNKSPTRTLSASRSLRSWIVSPRPMSGTVLRGDGPAGHAEGAALDAMTPFTAGRPGA
jgi:hypothetical protein